MVIFVIRALSHDVLIFNASLACKVASAVGFDSTAKLTFNSRGHCTVGSASIKGPDQKRGTGREAKIADAEAFRAYYDAAASFTDRANKTGADKT